jgi:hypothetical protein
MTPGARLLRPDNPAAHQAPIRAATGVPSGSGADAGQACIFEEGSPYATYFSRKLLVTTVTLESAMAADASIGESSPIAATGMPTTL